MWVRNQSKTSLINCESFVVTDENEIVYGDPFDTYVILGEYSTKERCLEVLDEIQQAIVESNIKRYEYVNSESNKIEYTYNNISVYKMPKE